MNIHSNKPLTGRERQIMEIVYERGQATALDIQEALPHLPKPLGNSSVRTLLRILEDKGHLTHRKQGAHFVYVPTQPRQQVAHAALAQVVKTFFENNVERVVTALLSTADTRLSAEELKRLSELIERARNEEIEE